MSKLTIVPRPSIAPLASSLEGSKLTEKARPLTIKPSISLEEEKKYSTKTQRQHIYDVPDLYAGSDEQTPREAWVYHFDKDKILRSYITIPQVVEHVFREVANNAADNVGHTRRRGRDPGVIRISMDDCTVTVYNEGEPMAIERATSHPDIYNPEMVFGMLLSSSHYSEKVRKDLGRNGFGAKITNIFSLTFIVRIGDAVRKLEYKQEWRNNMQEVDRPTITPYTGKHSYVSVTYTLDFKRFGYDPQQGYPQEALMLFAKHAADLSFTAKVPVHFSLKSKAIQKELTFDRYDIHRYATFYFSPESIATSIYYAQYPEGVETSKIKGRLVPKDGYSNPIFEILLLDTPSSSETVSFANTGATIKDGVHVTAAIKAACDTIISAVNGTKRGVKKGKKDKEGKEVKGPTINIKDVRPHLSMVLNCYVEDPKFGDQMKTCLESPIPKITIDENTLKPMLNWNLAGQLYASLENKQYGLLKKQDGKKKRFIGVNKVDDANEAGGKESGKCSLFLVEGDSALSYPRLLREMLPNGNDYFGILPLRGKILNVMNANFKRVAESQELANLKTVMGLREGVDYMNDENYDTLRYGNVIILADADRDGTHIIGLVLAYFYCRFPSLIRRQCVYFLRTPIYRISKGVRHLRFHTEGEFSQWKENTPDWSTWTIEYFKGLGSSEKDHIREDSDDLRYVVCVFDNTCDASMRLAFDKKLTDDRKVWIANWDAIPFIDPQEKFILKPITEFVHKELICYGVANLIRSIPRVTDGLKPGQRKIVWTIFLKWGQKQPHKGEKMKVSQFGAMVAKETSYHHGEASLFAAIIIMAQCFVGSNNMPHFRDHGGFGTRAQGGKDAGSPRYIFVGPKYWIPYIYHPDDFPLLTFMDEDGVKAEPENMLQVLPIIVMNGCLGIGSGHSTYIPPHNPLDVSGWFKARLRGQTYPPLKPWFRGFKGKIIVTDENSNVINYSEASNNPLLEDKPFGLEELPLEEGEEEGTPQTVPISEPSEKGKRRSMVTEGLYEEDEKGTITVTELPIGRWELNYKHWLEKLATDKEIKDFKSYCSDESGPRFIIKGFPDPSTSSLDLRKVYGLSNMVLLDANNYPRKYETIEEVMETFYEWRLPFYAKRKENLVNQLRVKVEALENKVKFTTLVKEGKIDIRNQDRASLRATMESYKLPFSLAEKTTVTQIIREGVEEILAKIATARTKLEALIATEVKDIWLQDIEAFETAYTQDLNSKSKSKTKKVVIKRK